MKSKLYKITSFVFISLYFCTGCFLNTNENLKENINKLPDKKFHFSEFDYNLIGQSKEEALNFFKKFPVKKIMFMLATEYNITIDISEFQSFINSNDLSIIETEGILRVTTNKWRKKNSENNSITITFDQDYFDERKLKLKIGIYNGGSSLKIINTEMSSIDYIFERLKYFLQSGKDSIREYNDKNYDKISPIPLILENSSKSPVIDEQMEIVKIKSLIDNYLKTLDPDKKDAFKHEIIDYLYKK